MSQRIAIVTGGIGGLGSEICKQLARTGCKVIAADLGSNPDRISAFEKDVASFDGAIRFAAINVADFDNCATVINEIAQAEGRVDILINAAGITRDGTLRKMVKDQWNDVLRVNLDGAFNTCRQVVDGMCNNGFGRIVNISSVNGQTGQFGQTNYAASKAGIHGFTMSLSREVARKGVTVNSISPGYCNTPLVQAIPEDIRNQIIAQIPVGRIGEPSEIARTVTFLTADEAGYITGANIPVNGGLFISF